MRRMTRRRLTEIQQNLADVKRELTQGMPSSDPLALAEALAREYVRDVDQLVAEVLRRWNRALR